MLGLNKLSNLNRVSPKWQKNQVPFTIPIENVELAAGGRGASVSACADLTNQLQCCWVDPACAWKKH